MELTTDHLIIGAGALGMGFLEEVVLNSSMEAIIVDIRDKPGGHWNDAYSFVRLHHPAVTYGLNSRSLGVAEWLNVEHRGDFVEGFLALG